MTVDLFDRLLQVVDRRIARATAQVGAWGEVTATDPVRVKFAGVGAPVRVQSAVGVSVAVGDRVALDLRGARWVIAYKITEGGS